MNATETNPRYPGFLLAARACIISNGTWHTPEAVAALAAEQDSCAWHAAHTLTMQHLDELGYGTCTICGGVTAPGQNPHHLCKARQDRGRDVPQLNATPTCPCAKCSPRRAGL